MLKKIVLSLMAALLIAVSFSGIVFAAEDDPNGSVKARGEVIVVDLKTGNFQIEKNDGTTLTFFVSEETRFRGFESLDELQVGWKTGVTAREDQDGKLWAVVVIAGDRAGLIKVRGKITDINTSAGKFSIEKQDGTKMTFFVDENTRYGGQIQGLEDLQVGWGAAVVAKEPNPGKLVAVGLIAGAAPDLVKAKGAVTSVTLSGEKFEIETSDGRTIQYFVDEKTRYQGQLSSLEELKVGWQAAVAAKEGEDGKLTAVLVIAGTRPEQIRAKGIIVGVDANAGKFRLEKPDGNVLTIYVDGNTKYRGQVNGVDDLEKGLRAGFGGFIDEDGKIIARIVIAGNPSPELPEVDDQREERPLPESDIPLEPWSFDTLSFPINNS